jgi:hypothetical protein
MNMSLQNACLYLGIGETVLNEKIAAGDLPPKVCLAGTRRVGFDAVFLENARLRMHSEPAMTSDQAIAFRAITAAALIWMNDKPVNDRQGVAPTVLRQPLKAVNSVFGLGEQTVRHRLKK